MRPLLAVLLFALTAIAQNPPAQTSSASQTPKVVIEDVEPRPEDVSSIDGMMKAFYDIVSGPKGEPREWSRDRTLYIPGVRFVMMGMNADGTPRANVVSHQEFVEQTNGQLVNEGFYERELHREVRRFGNVAHVWSTYEFRTDPKGPVLGRGVNSIEMFWDGERWWIAGAQWDSEREGNPLTKEWLPTAKLPGSEEECGDLDAALGFDTGSNVPNTGGLTIQGPSEIPFPAAIFDSRLPGTALVELTLSMSGTVTSAQALQGHPLHVKHAVPFAESLTIAGKASIPEKIIATVTYKLDEACGEPAARVAYNGVEITITGKTRCAPSNPMGVQKD